MGKSYKKLKLIDQSLYNKFVIRHEISRASDWQS